MKKLLALVLAAACAVSTTACAAKTGGEITLPEDEQASGQLAAPPAETSAQYPDEMDFIKDGEVDYDAYGKAYDGRRRQTPCCRSLTQRTGSRPASRR